MRDLCECGHDSREHAHGLRACWYAERRNLRRRCPCVAFKRAPVVRQRGTRDRCVRCGVTHAMPGVALPWCPVAGRKGKPDAF